jgi:lipopolysaccharide export LptBFGC system permease protein LptF
MKKRYFSVYFLLVLLVVISLFLFTPLLSFLTEKLEGLYGPSLSPGYVIGCDNDGDGFM